MRLCFLLSSDTMEYVAQWQDLVQLHTIYLDKHIFVVILCIISSTSVHDSKILTYKGLISGVQQQLFLIRRAVADLGRGTGPPS
jgi:hypothetical protein